MTKDSARIVRNLPSLIRRVLPSASVDESKAWAVSFGLLVVVSLITGQAALSWGRAEITINDLHDSNAHNPQPFWNYVYPEQPVDTIFFFAMLISVFVAYTLYHGFPHYYELFDLPEGRHQFLHNLLPPLHLLIAFAALVLTSSSTFHLHMVFVLLYFFMFVLWDLILRNVPEKGELNCKDREHAQAFRQDVARYFRDIDLPTFATLLLLYVFSSTFWQQADHRGHGADTVTHAFMAGVVASQAVAAFLNIFGVIRDGVCTILRSLERHVSFSSRK